MSATAMKHIQTSEFGYLLIQELITMKDRGLAERIELAIWKDSPEPVEERLNAFIAALQNSEDGSMFAVDSRQILEDNPSW